MSRKDNQIAAEYARALHHLKRMEGMLCWDAEGLWLVQCEAHPYTEDRQQIIPLLEAETPNRQTLLQSLHQGQYIKIDKGRLSQWTFHRRSLPTAKEFQALAATGTPPLRKYRNRKHTAFFRNLTERIKALQLAFAAWQHIQHTPSTHQDPHQRIILDSLAIALATTYEPVAMKQTHISHVRTLLRGDIPEAVGALALATSASLTQEGVLEAETAERWRAWWDAIFKHFPKGPKKAHRTPLFLLMSAHPEKPQHERLSWLSTQHTASMDFVEPHVMRLGLWQTPSQGWALLEETAPHFSSLAQPQQSARQHNATARLQELLQIFQAIAQNTQPIGRFEDIELHKALLSLRGTHTERGRKITTWLVQYLGTHAWPLEQSGAQRQLARDITRHLHNDDWAGMISSIQHSWRKRLTEQEQRAESTQQERLYDCQSNAKRDIQKAWENFLYQPPPRQKHRRSGDAYGSYDFYNDEPTSSRPSPEPTLPAALEGLLTPPDPTEVPRDKRGWSEWLWHRSWEATPGKRATIWHAMQGNQSIAYETPAYYHLWKYEPHLAAECEVPDERVLALLASDGDLSYLSMLQAPDAQTAFQRFDDALRYCRSSPQQFEQIIDAMSRAASKLELQQLPGDHLYPIDPPNGLMLCAPELVLSFVKVNKELIRGKHAHDDIFEYWYPACEINWWQSMLHHRCFNTVSAMLHSGDETMETWAVRFLQSHKSDDANVAPQLRKMLRRETRNARKEALALALGQQGQIEDAWPLIVLMRKAPSLAFLVAIERCGQQQFTEEAHGLWQPPTAREELLCNAHFDLLQECQHPALPNALWNIIKAEIESTDKKKPKFTGRYLHWSLLLLASQKKRRSYLRQSIAELDDKVPQWCSRAAKDALIAMSGLFEEIASKTLGTKCNTSDALPRWMAECKILHESEFGEVELPRRIELQMWHQLLTAEERADIVDILDAFFAIEHCRWLTHIDLLDLTRDKEHWLSPEMYEAIANKIYYLTSDFNHIQLVCRCIANAPTPQALVDRLPLDLRNPLTEIYFWRHRDDQDSAIGRVFQLQLTQTYNHHAEAFLIGGIGFAESWLPPDEAAPLIRLLLQNWNSKESEQENQYRMQLEDTDVNELLLVEGTWEYDSQNCFIGNNHITSYRVQSMLIEELLPRMHFNKAAFREQLERQAAVTDDPEAFIEHPRNQWLLERLDAHLP